MPQSPFWAQWASAFGNQGPMQMLMQERQQAAEEATRMRLMEAASRLKMQEEATMTAAREQWERSLFMQEHGSNPFARALAASPEGRQQFRNFLGLQAKSAMPLNPLEQAELEERKLRTGILKKTGGRKPIDPQELEFANAQRRARGEPPIDEYGNVLEQPPATAPPKRSGFPDQIFGEDGVGTGGSHLGAGIGLLPGAGAAIGALTKEGTSFGAKAKGFLKGGLRSLGGAVKGAAYGAGAEWLLDFFSRRVTPGAERKPQDALIEGLFGLPGPDAGQPDVSRLPPGAPFRELVERQRREGKKGLSFEAGEPAYLPPVTTRRGESRKFPDRFFNR